MLCTLQMSQRVEMVSNFQLKKIGLKVRRYGPQPRIFVRSFSQITTLHSFVCLAAFADVAFLYLSRVCTLPVPAARSGWDDFLLFHGSLPLSLDVFSSILHRQSRGRPPTASSLAKQWYGPVRPGRTFYNVSTRKVVVSKIILRFCPHSEVVEALTLGPNAHL